MSKAAKLATPLQRVLSMRDGTGSWFVSAMDTYYEQSEQPRNDGGWFHPSALSHGCDAFLAFQYLGLPQAQTISARTRRIFDNGHSTEARWQTAIQKAGLAECKTKKDRLVVIEQHRIRGELDNIIRHPLTGERFVFEFKTKNHDLFEKMRGPDAGWIPQVHAYMFGRGVLQTMIVVEDKNNQEVKTFVVPFDGALWRGITERLERIVARLEQRQEIARTPLLRDSECSYYAKGDGFAGCAAHDFGGER